MTDTEKTITTVAVDAMGGDFGPSVVVPGVVEALRTGDVSRVAFYGEPDSIDEANRVRLHDQLLNRRKNLVQTRWLASLRDQAEIEDLRSQFQQ